MPTLHVIVASTREGRAGLPVAEWFLAHALADGRFEPELVDLKALHLPMIDEPHHPRLRDYTHAHTRAWSATVDRADAFVFVIPEYNHFAPPALVNAIDYLYWEWQGKAASFVSYGGASGGMRSMQSLKPMLTGLKVMPLPESVSVHFVAQHIQDGIFTPNDSHKKAATGMLAELHRWTEALAVLRQPAAGAAARG